MKFSRFVLLLAFLGGASARAAPAHLAAPEFLSRTGVDSENAPVQMQISEAFLSEATAGLDAAGAHKLPYSNPSTGACQKDEAKVSINGIPGAFCSPTCNPANPCPKDAHFGATAEGQCVLETPGHAQPSQCALICKPSAGGCPRGASCQPIQGLGICTYPAGPREDETVTYEVAEDN